MSTGSENIPAIVLKHLPDIIIKNYTVLFNNAEQTNISQMYGNLLSCYPYIKKTNQQTLRPVTDQ